MPPIASPKIILITGSSRGFGLLIAARLASSGHTVIASMRNLNKKDSLLSEVSKRGGHVDVIQLDVTDPDSIKKAMSYVVTKYGYLDVLVNNAGYGIGGFFEDLSEEEIRQQMETNFFGIQNLTRLVIPLMRPRKSGKIINISSISGQYGSPAFGAYNASKWALEGFSESLYHELRFFGINVVLIEPGTYNTSIFHENAQYAQEFDNPASPYFPMSQYLKQKILNYVNNVRKDPETIALGIEKIINIKNPSLRYAPDWESRILIALRKFLPFKLYCFFYQKMLWGGFKP